VSQIQAKQKNLYIWTTERIGNGDEEIHCGVQINEKGGEITGIWDWIIRIICGLLRLFGFGRNVDITVVEDSENDNGYLVQKAEHNPGCIRATSKEDMVNKVLNRLRFCDCIKTLKLVGHGSPGNISVGDGQGWESCKHINGNRDEWEAPLSRLKGKFCKNARILLVGCHVGACESGRQKLQELADFFWATIEAPTGNTYGNCTEESGSEHQIATPGGDPPPHKESPSDQKKKKERKPMGEQKMPLKVEEIQSIGIHPAQLAGELESSKDASCIYSEMQDIEKFLSGIDFSHTVDGKGLGADYDAHVFITVKGEVKEYRICADFDYFLEKGDWENMYEITWDLKQELRKLIRETLDQYRK